MDFSFLRSASRLFCLLFSGSFPTALSISSRQLVTISASRLDPELARRLLLKGSDSLFADPNDLALVVEISCHHLVATASLNRCALFVDFLDRALGSLPYAFFIGDGLALIIQPGLLPNGFFGHYLIPFRVGLGHLIG